MLKVTLNLTNKRVVPCIFSARQCQSHAVPREDTMFTEQKYQELQKMQARPLYLDAQATTPLDPRVLDVMMPYMTSFYGNPHSRTHAFGWESEKAVEKARAQVASLIKADPKEIVFTSGATESNNMAIKGVAKFYEEKKKHIITTQTVS